MKKIIIFIICVLGIISSKASNYKPQQLSFRNDIKSYLYEEGYAPTINSNTEDINFKIEGTNYSIELNTDYNGPFLVSINARFNMDELSNNELKKLYTIENEVNNSFNCVKCYYMAFEDVRLLSFSVESFCHNSEDFKYALAKYISLMKSAIAKFQELYDEIDESPTSGNHSTSSASSSQFREVICPSMRNGSDSDLHITKVTIKKDYTILDMVSYNGGQYQNCCIDRGSYLVANGNKYYLVNAEGISYGPTYTDYPNYQSGYNVPLTFKLYFQPIPVYTKSFDFYESSKGGWSITNIDVQESNKVFPQSEWIKTTDHKWQLVSVQVYDDKTVVTKRCIPNSGMTWICSSKDEFIEDAETGQRYHLLNSDIGLENNKHIAYGQKEYFFNEIYPRLPLNVKKVNVSSGSTYYIKNLRIRQ